MTTGLASSSSAAPSITNYTTPPPATGIGLTEAPRGALGHWVKIATGKIASYQVITPTCWNASPATTHGQRARSSRR